METAFVRMTGAQMTRRRVLQLTGLGVALTCAARMTEPSFALKPGKPSKERLLRGTREDKTEEQIAEEKARIAEERKTRLEKQRELQAAAERKRAGLEVSNENEIEIESSLRGQYYFPTARKRYLPRVKRAWDSIPAAEEALRQDRWSMVTQLCESELADAVLPMRLYASSLSGGGLSINAHFIDKMNSATAAYETSLTRLTNAAQKKDLGVALGRLGEMRAAIQGYRESGHLEAADFGIGEIPKGARIGSGFGNNNSALYGRNKGVQDVITDTALER